MIKMIGGFLLTLNLLFYLERFVKIQSEHALPRPQAAWGRG